MTLLQSVWSFFAIQIPNATAIIYIAHFITNKLTFN